MNHALAQLIVDHTEGRLYESYSGRGMFGATTTGVVVPRGTDLAGVIYDLAHEISDLKDQGVLPESNTFAIDQLGLEVIIY